MLENQGAILQEVAGAFTLERWDVEPDASDVVVEIELCGLCGSDVHLYHGEWVGASFPVLLGHENVGRVAWCPEGTTDVFGRPVSEGDRVVVASAYFGNCGRCYQCAELNAPWACSHKVTPRLLVSDRQVAVFGGGLARYLRLSPPESRMLVRTDVAAEAAVLYEPFTVAVQMLREGGPVLGADVVVQGTGAIGLLTVALAKAAGAATVIAVGAPAHRLQLARELGADLTVDIAEVPDPAARSELVRAATYGSVGAAVSYEIAGVPHAVGEGLSYLRPSGVLVEAGSAADTGTTTIHPHLDIQRSRRRIIGARGRELSDFTVAARLLERFEPQLRRLLTHRLPIDRVADGLAALGGQYRLSGEDLVKVAIAPTVHVAVAD